jgi:hypothetical protein
MKNQKTTINKLTKFGKRPMLATDYRGQKMEIFSKLDRKAKEAKLRQQLDEIYDTIRHLPDLQFREGVHSVSQLRQITVARQAATKVNQDDFATSFASAENRLALCIAQLLANDVAQNPSRQDILELLRAQKVFLGLPNQTGILSLHEVFVTLQDNFPSSFLTSFLMLIIEGDHMGRINPATIAL